MIDGSVDCFDVTGTALTRMMIDGSVDCFDVTVINVLIKRGVRLVVWTLC